MDKYLILAISTLLATGKALFCKALGTGQYSKRETAILNFKALFVAFICSNIADNNYREYLYWKRLDKECEKEDKNDAGT